MALFLKLWSNVKRSSSLIKTTPCTKLHTTCFLKQSFFQGLCKLHIHNLDKEKYNSKTYHQDRGYRDLYTLPWYQLQSLLYGHISLMEALGKRLVRLKNLNRLSRILLDSKIVKLHSNKSSNSWKTHKVLKILEPEWERESFFMVLPVLEKHLWRKLALDKLKFPFSHVMQLSLGKCTLEWVLKK